MLLIAAREAYLHIGKHHFGAEAVGGAARRADLGGAEAESPVAAHEQASEFVVPLLIVHQPPGVGAITIVL